MKLRPEHLGNKFKRSCWVHSPFSFFIPKFIDDEGQVFGLTHENKGTWHSINCDDWEIYEEPQQIPADQAWVVPGKKYQRKMWNNGEWFIPEKFCSERLEWDGKTDFDMPYAWQMNDQNTWREYTPTVRMAPALVKHPDAKRFMITDTLYESEHEAREAYDKCTTVKWCDCEKKR